MALDLAAQELRPGERSGDVSQMAVGEVEVQYVPVAMGGAKVRGECAPGLPCHGW